jgi:hypothetical protein
MTGWGTVALAALAGLNPWVVLVIVVGLATYTRHAPLNQPYSEAANVVGLVLFAAFLGIEVLLSKLKRIARWLEVVNLPAAAVTGALLPLALLSPGEDVIWLVLPSMVVALALRWMRLRASPRLDRWLRPYGHVAASMLADLLAGVGTAAVFALGA